MCRKHLPLVVLVIALVGLFATILAFTPVQAENRWTWQNPQPNGVQVNALWGTSSSNVYAVGPRGAILHYDGTTWSSMVSGTTLDLRAIWGSGPNDIYVPADLGTLLHFDGTVWATASPWSDVSGRALSIWGTAPDNIYIGAESGIMHFDGTGWQPASALNTNMAYVKGFWGTGPANVYAAGDHLYHFTGSGWSEVDTGTSGFTSIWGSNANDIFVTTAGGNLLHYDGVQWATTQVSWAGLLSVWGSGPNDVYAGDQESRLFHYNGLAWNEVAGLPFRPKAVWAPTAAIWGTSNSDVLVSAGNIYHYDGTAWRTTRPSVTDRHLNAVWGTSGVNVFAVGQDGVILHYDGERWQVMASGTTQSLNSIWGSGPENIYAVGAGGTILRYDGAQWQAMSSGTTDGLAGVWGSGPNDIFAVGGERTVIHYDGTSWQPLSAGGSQPYYPRALWGSSSTDVYVTGFQGGIKHYNGVDWENSWWGVGTYVAIWGQDQAHRVAAGNANHVVVSDGSAWQLFNFWPGNYYYFRAIWGDTTGYVYFSATDGSIWQTESSSCFMCSIAQMQSPANLSLNAIWGSSQDDIFAVGSNGAILHYGSETPSVLLTVAKTGIGAGAIASIPAGIACGITCTSGSSLFPQGTVVTLTQTAAPGAVFTGWSGACSGLDVCTLTLTTRQAVTATFDIVGATFPQPATMYYGTQLTAHPVVAAGVGVTATLLVFPTAPPPNVYMLGVAGTQPYTGQASVDRRINDLLRNGCNSQPCTAVACSYFGADGHRTDMIISQAIATDHLYLPYMRAR